MTIDPRLTGIHLMRTGVVQANLPILNEEFKLSYVNDLIARKIGGAENSTLSETDFSFYGSEYVRLRAELESAFGSSKLPDLPSARDRMDALLIELRLISR